MTYLRNNLRRGFRYVNSDKGITLIELMIAMGVAGIVLMAIYSAYYTQTLMHRKQTVVLNMQQNIRGGLYLMEREIRMAGYDQNDTDAFGITDIRFRDTDNQIDLSGNSSIIFTADLDNDGVLDANETIAFSVYDYPVSSPDGVTDLAMNNGGNRQLAAESIQALFLAYAYDNNGDDTLDTSAGGNIIWAFDSDNDNVLDQILDTNDDGLIDINDSTAGTAIGGSGVAVGNIRAVRVWLLARTKTPILNYTDNNTYVIGNRRFTPNDNFRRELLDTIIKCRNLLM